jgi:hypothetical protein
MASFWAEALVVGHLPGLHAVAVLASGVICFPSFARNCSVAVDHHHNGLVNYEDCYMVVDPSNCFLPPPAPAK